MASDVFQSIGSLDAEGVQRIVDRLEFRGKDDAFVAMRDQYLEKMNLASGASILDLGCGTGVVARALAAREDVAGQIVGVDYSEDLIDAAHRLATEEGVGDRIDFRVGDASSLQFDDESFDAVILHTVVSHVPDPAATLAEAGRVVRPGNVVAIFDGDYASVTFATGDHNEDAEMVQAMLSSVVANPYVMRELPFMLGQEGFELECFIPNVLAEAGFGAFFSGMAEAYAPMAARAGLVSQVRADDWINAYREAALASRVFASCNYYTFLARRPG